jgi:putative phosphoribosyl transferase
MFCASGRIIAPPARSTAGRFPGTASAVRWDNVKDFEAPMNHREDILVHHAPAGGFDGWIYRDRAHAGAVLGANLQHLRGRRPLVLGIARGGVPVAREVAHRLGGELDVFVARKLGLPGQQELAMGAIASDGTCYIDRKLVLELGVSDAALGYATRVQSAEAQRRERLFRRERAHRDPAGRVVVLVDDGLATGATMLVAVRSVSQRKPAHLVVAVPVGAPSTCDELAPLVDELVCPYRPELFHAVGQYYRRFDQTSDDEVVRILGERSQHPPS